MNKTGRGVALEERGKSGVFFWSCYFWNVHTYMPVSEDVKQVVGYTSPSQNQGWD